MYCFCNSESHICDILKRANGKLYILRALKRHGLPVSDLRTIYLGYVRPILEYGTPVWNGGLTKSQSERLERVQKRALRIIYASAYTHYEDILETCELTTLEERREKLCLDFIKSSLSETTQFREFIPTPTAKSKALRKSRTIPDIKCKTERMKNSPLPYLIRLLNE